MSASTLGIGTRIEHEKFGEGIISGMDMEFYSIFFRNHGDKEIARSYEGMEVLEHVEAGEGTSSLSLEDVENAENVAESEMQAVAGGMLPGFPGLG